MEEPCRMPLGDGTCLLLYEILGSTQDVARACAKAGKREVVGVLTKHQTAGRGRWGRVWQDVPGDCLLATYILYPDGPQPVDPGALAFIAAVAVAEAVEEQSGVLATLKWPNDVLANRRKLAGILIETTESPSGETVALVGVGLNVNIPAFPPPLSRQATSLLLETGRAFSIEAIEDALRKTLFSDYRCAMEQGIESIFARWKQRDITPGSRFRATVNAQEVEGVALGIGESGALLLRTDTGSVIEVLSATSIDR